MSHVRSRLLPKFIVITCTLTLLGCSSAINPFYYKKHPQKNQSFSNRRPVRDNAFIESGGLAKKNKVNPFATNIGENGFYSVNPGVNPMEKPKPTYNNPLADLYPPQTSTSPQVPASSQTPASQQQGQLKVKGTNSSIVSFFKNSFTKTKSMFSGNSDIDLNRGANDGPPLSSDDSSAQQDNQIQAQGDIKRSPSGNGDGYESYSDNNEHSSVEVAQGGSLDTGYTYYDQADEVPKNIKVVSNEVVEDKLEIKEPMIINTNVRVNLEHEPAGIIQRNNNIDTSKVIFSQIPAQTEFDNYYIQQKQNKPSINNFFQKYVNKALNIFKPAEAHAASIMENELNLNDGDEEINELSNLETPIISDQDIADAKKNNPNLKDVPPYPDKFKELDKYQKDAEDLKKKTKQ